MRLITGRSARPARAAPGEWLAYREVCTARQRPGRATAGAETGRTSDRRVAGMLVAQPPHQTIRITEAGLTARSIESRTIAWDKACVFALVEGGKRPGSTAIYILSSGRNSVRWSYRPRTRWYSVTTPTTSDEEYRRQMNALLSYIATRTGLPLLDLR